MCGSAVVGVHCGGVFGVAPCATPWQNQTSLSLHSKNPAQKSATRLKSKPARNPNPQLRFDDAFDDASSGPQAPEQLPEWACAYCGVHNPASVVRCCTTGKVGGGIGWAMLFWEEGGGQVLQFWGVW